MSLPTPQSSLPRIIYSCYYNVSREGENFVPEHVLTCQMSGALKMYDGKNEYNFAEGSYRFTRKNQLAKFTKQPPPGGEFKSLSIRMDEEILRTLSHEMGITSAHSNASEPVFVLPPDPLLKGYFNSIFPYLQLPPETREPLLDLKVREAVLLLLRLQPALKNILFDFSQPGKIDLEAFMLQHFHFNVSLNRFAYLTGRSLATFKRDFERIFHSSPSRWLQQKRLQEAYYQIKEKGRKASDVYLDVGFEDLSHFSYAFKKQYGAAPTRV